MHDKYALSPGQKDDLLQLLADHRRRAVLAYLRQSTDGVASLEELIDEIEGHGASGEQEAAVQLNHIILPRLAEQDFIQYDRERGTIQYHHHPGLETLINTINGL